MLQFHEMLLLIIKFWGVCGQVVKVVDFKHFLLTILGVNLVRDFGFFHDCELVIQINQGMVESYACASLGARAALGFSPPLKL
jgi:hypothetical protein